MKTETLILFAIGAYILWNYSRSSTHPVCPVNQAWDFNQGKCVDVSWIPVDLNREGPLPAEQIDTTGGIFEPDFATPPIATA